MRIAVLAAAGATGLELTRQALERGHTVTAIARTPDRIAVPDSPLLTRAAADVTEPGSLAAALGDAEVLLSGLGTDTAGVLTTGARAAVAALTKRPGQPVQLGRIIWLGAFGTGASAKAAGLLTRTMLRLMGARLADKVTADSAVLAAGGTVFHAGPLSGAPLSPSRRTVGLEEVPRRLFPASVGRATVAAAMLDEAERPRYPGTTAVPLER
jgi:hypothetical protein